MPEIQIDTVFASVYAVVLLGCAYGIDLLAKRAARSLEGRQRGGFVYHEDHDAWRCPQDQWLWPHSYDPDNRVMRYRANPIVCNSCPVKDTCTYSSGGREIRRHVDPWPASEAAKFHRGIACTVTVLAVVWPIAMMLSGVTATELIVLAAVTAAVALGALPLWSHLRRTPVDPTGVLRLNEAQNDADHRRAAADYLATRTSYRSDRREAAASDERSNA